MRWPSNIVILMAYLALAIFTAPGWTSEGWPIVYPLLAAIAAWAIQSMILAVAFRTVLELKWTSRHPISRAVVVLASIVTGSIVVSVTAITLVPNDAYSVLVSESISAWMVRFAIVLTVAVAVPAIRNYATRLSEIRATTATLDQARLSAVRAVEEQRVEVVEQVSEMLETDLVQGRNYLPSVDVLQSLARDRIRPLSHELAGTFPPFRPTRPGRPAAVSWREVFMHVSEKPLIQPLFMAIVVTAAFVLQTSAAVSTSPQVDYPSVADNTPTDGLAFSGNMESFFNALFFLALIFVATWVTGIAATRLTRDRLPLLSPLNRVITTIATLVIMSIIVQLLIQLLYVLPGLARDLSTDIALRVLVTMPILMIAIAIAVTRTVQGLLVEIELRYEELQREQAWAIARANQTLAQERRFLASTLHGPIQSIISAAALTIEKAGDNPTALASAWDAAQLRITESVEALMSGPPERRDLQQELSLMQTTWTGLCDVHATIAPDVDALLSSDWICAGTISDLIVESVANAVMHGKARKVLIEIRKGKSATIKVQVVNDGSAPSENPTPGLGSQLLDDLTIAWNRCTDAQGSRLNFEVPAGT